MSIPERTRPSAQAITLWVAVGLAVLTAILMFAIVPSVTIVESSSSGASSESTETLLEAMGPRALIIAAVPTVITLVPAFLPRRARTIAAVIAAVLLTVWAVLAAFTVGVYYIPTIAALVVAAALHGK
ncbi:hypothetical protein [Microbacterium gorillae]|uniref:hypothetical protein n=1 Tax=Microbacterium gorillae TaxID=1231063 RepID=UPI000590F6CB|nr:hypothetical protein [Microbacterium gorillae]